MVEERREYDMSATRNPQGRFRRFRRHHYSQKISRNAVKLRRTPPHLIVAMSVM